MKAAGYHTALPPEQQAIWQKCFHPSRAFVEFKKEEVEQSIPDRFEKIVRLYPERTAVKMGDWVLTYTELNTIANRLARAILRQTGGEAVAVGLLFEKGLPPIAAMIAVLKAGKFFVLLDPSFPKPRITAMLEDSGASLIVADRRSSSLARQMAGSRCRVIDFESIDQSTAGDDLRLALSPQALAFIVYTSGSTGEPKGVLQSHRSVLKDAMLRTNTLHLCEHDRFSLLSSGTSNAVKNSVMTLLTGAALLPFDVQREGATRLTNWLLQERITICLISAPLFRNLAENLTGNEGFRDLRIIRLTSESANKTDVALYKKFFPPTCILVGGLNSSEAGLLRTCFIDHDTEIPDSQLPVGYGLEDMDVLLLTDEGKEVGFNEVGEIVVRSRYLSPGYWRRPDLTEAKFKPDPEGGDSRLYFTGDLGLMLPDGCLMHKGRKDFRVKIRGYGVEIAEVEKALREHPAVKDAVVVARPNKLSEAALAAYFTSATRPGPSVSGLQKFLKQKLSDYMIPSAFVMLEKIPLTANGKIDRQALPEPGTARPNLDTPFVAPRTSVENELARMWREVLKKESVGMQDNFFDLGGDSLLATKILVRVKNLFDLELPLAAMFENPTIAEFAERIARAQPKAGFKI